MASANPMFLLMSVTFTVTADPAWARGLVWLLVVLMLTTISFICHNRLLGEASLVPAPIQVGRHHRHGHSGFGPRRRPNSAREKSATDILDTA